MYRFYNAFTVYLRLFITIVLKKNVNKIKNLKREMVKKEIKTKLTKTQ